MIATKQSVALQRSAASRPVAARVSQRRVVVVRAAESKEKVTGAEQERKDLTDAGGARKLSTGSESDAYQAPWWQPVFSRRREAFVGRLAMLGFSASAAWEVLTPQHLGPIGIVSGLTGLSPSAVSIGYTIALVYGLLGAIIPGSPTFDKANQEDIQKRPDGPLQKGINPITKPGQAAGTSSSVGFTKKNELFTGRAAMLGFLAAVINEPRSGGLGAIGQVAWWLGNNRPAEEWYSTWGLAILVGALITGTAAFLGGKGGTVEGENDIY